MVYIESSEQPWKEKQDNHKAFLRNEHYENSAKTVWIQLGARS